jgi:peroxiredoxin Q/BCP
LNVSKKTNKSVKVGDKAPNFELKDQNGKVVRLSELYDRSSVVLYFYPKDNSPGCTTQACTFRDQYEVFKDRGAEVLGISSDSVASHRKFGAKYNLPFSILSDTNGKIRKLYGVKSTIGLIPGRVTFIIDRKGMVRYTFSSQLNVKEHVDKALEILLELESEEKNAATLDDLEIKI